MGNKEKMRKKAKVNFIKEHEGDSCDLRKILDRVTVLEESWCTRLLGAAHIDSGQQGQKDPWTKVSSENNKLKILGIHQAKKDSD